MSNNIGALLTQGGVPATGLQTALNQYTKGEGEVANAAQFSAGMGHSTGATQGATGPLANLALQQGQNVLQNTAAQENFLNQSFSNFAGGVGNILGKLGGAVGGGGGGG
jgi:hypothetical protein